MKLVLISIILLFQAVSFSPTLADGLQPAAGDTLIGEQMASDLPAADSTVAEASAADTATMAPAEVESLGVDSAVVDPVEKDAAPADSVALVASDSAAARPPAIPMDQLREVENSAFGVGEYLEFEIAYGPIKAGTGIIEVKEIAEVNGRNCYHVISTARSNRVFSAFFKVEDRVDSFFDKRGLFTWRFEQHLREGKYRADRYAQYDQVNHVVTTNRGVFDIPPYVQDVLSTMYFIRTKPLEVGDVLYVDNHSGRKIYPLAIKILRRERVEVPSGIFDCLVVEPVLKAGGLFKHEGRVQVWLTDDWKKMPVLMKTKVIIGTVDAKLKSYRLGKIS